MNWPYELHKVPGHLALEKLAELQGQQTGIAILLGDAESFERMQETLEEDDSGSVEALIAEAEEINAADWLQQRLESDPEYFSTEDGDWPGEDELGDGMCITAHCDVLTGEPYAEVFLTVVPAALAWMAPCYLIQGGWNECPYPHEHAALFKHWQEKYGATVACWADDVIEMQVTRPPTTREEALKLAREHYLYCPDIVDQGVESVAGLAALLLNGRVWYFWWD